VHGFACVSFARSGRVPPELERIRRAHCSHTFVTMETIERTIMRPGHVVPVLPHPNNYGQQSMLM